MAFIQQVKEFDERVIAVDRVSRVVKGGRRFRFRATVVIGNGNGKVGVGVGKGGDVMSAISKSVAKAKRNMITVNLREHTIPHEIEVAFSGARVLLKPASAGTGVIAGGAVRSVLEVAGIRDILTKSIGSSNKLNCAYATILALSKLELVKRPEGKGQKSEVNTNKLETPEAPKAEKAIKKPVKDAKVAKKAVKSKAKS